jgi:lysozyme
MTINQAGLSLLKSCEGCKLEAYQDSVGVWTIGYGHTGDDVTPDLVITQDEADALLLQDLAKFENGVTDLVKVQLNSNQFSALVVFSYNVGIGNLKSSLLLRCINSLHYSDAAPQFLRWNKAGGVVVAGLTTRREKERDLFIS